MHFKFNHHNLFSKLLHFYMNYPLSIINYIFFIFIYTFRQPPILKGYEETNFFYQEKFKFNLRRLPGDDKIVVDVEKFKLIDYICELLVPKKV